MTDENVDPGSVCLIKKDGTTLKSCQRPGGATSGGPRAGGCCGGPPDAGSCNVPNNASSCNPRPVYVCASQLDENDCADVAVCRFQNGEERHEYTASFDQGSKCVTCRPGREVLATLVMNENRSIDADKVAVVKKSGALIKGCPGPLPADLLSPLLAEEPTEEASPPPQQMMDAVTNPVKEKEKDFGRNAGETRREYIKREYSALKPFVIVSLSYLLFTITDGAVRMIVLLHAYNKKFSSFEVAIMFTLYELGGVFTNLLAGVAGARWGIRLTLVTGLTLQLGGLGMLYGWQDHWTKVEAIIYVLFAQLLSGVSKDLTKLGGKTVTKLVTPDEKQGRLFKIVSWITGFKNSLKGVGYFIGAVLVAVNYYVSLSVLVALILMALPWAIQGLDPELGRQNKKSITLASVFKKNHNVNQLSIARFFLFGSRDLWFEVPLPFFLRSQDGLNWGRPATGAFLACYIILYGQLQSWTPQLFLKPLRQSPPNKWVAVLWAALLISTPLYLGFFLQCSSIFEPGDAGDQGGRVAVLVSGVVVFAVLFAINSSVHSYLIVKYAEGDKVAMNVGFYYMANAMGRLVGTLASGALYSYVGDNPTDGLAACFWASVGFVVMTVITTIPCRDDVGGLNCGPCLQFMHQEDKPGKARRAAVMIPVAEQPATAV
eukprot:jgi/Mesvir1/2185/Mv16690-RA.2